MSDIHDEYITADAIYDNNRKLMIIDVRHQPSEEVLHQEVIAGGTVNVAKYMSILYAVLVQEMERTKLPVYNNSTVALSWYNKSKGMCDNVPHAKKLEAQVYNLEDRPEVLQWNTKHWGYIDSVFNHKK